jgi:hypothetical protein
MELQKTPEGTKEFNLLVAKLGDTQDALGRVNIKGKELFGTLGLIPGPIGEIAARANSAIDALKVFGKFKASDLQAQFKALKDDFNEVGSSIFRLTGLKKLYVTSIRSVSQGLQAMGISIKTASTAAKAFAVTMTALTAATGLILVTILVNQLVEAYEFFAKKAERAEEAQKKLNETLLKGSKTALDAESASIKRSGDLLLAQAKARGDSADKIYKIEQDNRKLLLESQQRYLKEVKDLNNDEAIATEKSIEDIKNSILVAEADFQGERNRAAKEQKDKDDADAKAKLEKQNAINKQIADNEKAAAITLLDIRDQERRKIVNDYNTKINLAAANNADTLILEEAKLKALGELNDKYREEDAKNEREAEFQRLTTLVTDLDFENGLLDDDFQEDLQRLANKEAYVAELKKIELANLELTEGQRLEIIERYAKTEREIDQQITDTKQAEIQARMAMQMRYADYVQQIGNIIGMIAGDNKDLAIAGVIIEQGAALGKVLIGTASGIAGATSNAAKNPLNAVPGGSIIVAANLARQIVQLKIVAALSSASIIAGAVNSINQIKKAKTPGGSGGASAGAGGASTQAATPAFSGTVSVPAPVIGASQASQSGTLGQTIAGAVMEGNSKSRPIQAYVVGDQVTTQQQLDRRISVAAKMAG